MDGANTVPIQVSSGIGLDIADQAVPVSPTSTDGWGELENGIHEEHESEKDGWDDIEPLEDPKPSPALANIQAAQKRPVSESKPPGNYYSILKTVCNICRFFGIMWFFYTIFAIFSCNIFRGELSRYDVKNRTRLVIYHIV